MTKAEFEADIYKMDHNNRGYAVIINNKSFDPEVGLQLIVTLQNYKKKYISHVHVLDI
jgi:mRNA-degrading endonuclease toxin of MazEF toxin-antitoxin module